MGGYNMRILLPLMSVFLAFLSHIDCEAVVLNPKMQDRTAEELAARDFMAVCPPFFLLDEEGNKIDPANVINADKPYSPKKTCGKCHDYDLITSAYHFQQGQGERLSAEIKAMYPWMTTPGQYGGRY